MTQPTPALWQTLRASHFENVGSPRYDDAVRAGSFDRWRIDERKLALAARMSATAIVRKSSALRLGPYGTVSRLAPDGYDRFSALHGRFDALSYDELTRARSLADLLALASLLDLDPGPAWRMRSRTGALLGGQDGVLVVAYGLFVNGALSLEGAKDPLRVDGAALASLERSTLELAFASIDTEPAQRIDERLARLRAEGASLVASEDSLQRLGARCIDALSTAADGSVPSDVTVEALFSQAVRCTSATDRPDAAAPTYAMTESVTRYLELAYSWAALLSRLSLPVRAREFRLLPPDRWSVSLLVDTGVFSPTTDVPASEVVLDPGARTALLSLAPFALDALCAQVRALIKADAERLPKTSIVEWGTIAAGKALSARERPGGRPLFW